MDKRRISLLRWRFSEYVKRFQEDNSYDPYTQQNIQVKIGHTANVCRNILAICDSLGLEEEKHLTAEVIGLFHDIGRFEQIKKYRTFNDAKSENHAELGVRVLENEKFLFELSPEENEIITKAVLFHNTREIPLYEKEEIIFFSKLVRDADKMDILGILTGYYHSEACGSNPAFDLDLPENIEFTQTVIDDIFQDRCVDVNHAVTTTDFKLLQTSWVFDINFDYTFNYIREHGYVEKLMQLLPDRIEIREACEHIRNYLSFSHPKSLGASGPAHF
jgi:putative nucleotidyltransferase with HDIG domain